MKTLTHTLPCGLRIVCAESASDVTYCGIALNAGTRDEHDNENGMAHFCEHLTFKGTYRRRSWHILNRMENVGGDLNAYTGKEETVYYTAFLKEHFNRAVDLLCDLVWGSLYPQNEMDKEAEVVIDEIESYNDSPSELIFDDFENLIFDGHPLARNILGQADHLRTYRSAHLNDFANRLYTPRNAVLFVYGQITLKEAVQQVTRALERVARSLPDGHPRQQSLRRTDAPSPISNEEQARTAPAHYSPRELTVDKQTHQAHVMMGTRAYPATDPRHLSLYLLNNILGGPGMNSRLNLSLRERRGLVYTVESNLTTYTDSGLWCVYFGCDPKDVSLCRKLVLSELRKLTSAPLSKNALAAAKKQIKGQIGISYDNSESVALSMGKTFLHYNRTRDLQQLYNKIDALTAEDLFEVACELFRPERLATLIYK
ncbi:MAG: insulinase family protein [Clostridium sp.]|nr:insulinase family protein [Clostridium sp.]